MPDALKRTRPRFAGCWLRSSVYPRREGRPLHFLADSNVAITKGIVALVFERGPGPAGRENRRKWTSPVDGPVRTGQAPDADRSQGVPNMIALVKRTPEQYAAASSGFDRRPPLFGFLEHENCDRGLDLLERCRLRRRRASNRAMLLGRGGGRQPDRRELASLSRSSADSARISSRLRDPSPGPARAPLRRLADAERALRFLGGAARGSSGIGPGDISSPAPLFGGVDPRQHPTAGAVQRLGAGRSPIALQPSGRHSPPAAASAPRRKGASAREIPMVRSSSASPYPRFDLWSALASARSRVRQRAVSRVFFTRRSGSGDHPLRPSLRRGSSNRPAPGRTSPFSASIRSCHPVGFHRAGPVPAAVRFYRTLSTSTVRSRRSLSWHCPSRRTPAGGCYPARRSMEPGLSSPHSRDRRPPPALWPRSGPGYRRSRSNSASSLAQTLAVDGLAVDTVGRGGSGAGKAITAFRLSVTS